MRPKEYEISDRVIAKARRNGVYGNTAARLSRMAWRSAVITNRHGNRRFQSFVLLVDGATIKDVTRVVF